MWNLEAVIIRTKFFVDTITIQQTSLNTPGNSLLRCTNDVFSSLSRTIVKKSEGI